MKGCHLPSDNKVLVGGFSNIFSILTEKNEGLIFNCANKLCVQHGFDINKEFSAQASFGMPVQNLDFGNGNKAAAELNGFVDKITGGKITELINSGNF